MERETSLKEGVLKINCGISPRKTTQFNKQASQKINGILYYGSLYKIDGLTIPVKEFSSRYRYPSIV